MFSSSPTSIPATSLTNSPSVSAAAPLSEPSCKDSPGPRTTSPRGSSAEDIANVVVITPIQAASLKAQQAVKI